MTETLQTPVRELTTGSTFAGRYQVIEELGTGGMGRVYKVFDTKIKEKVALKLIKPEVASDKETIERFATRSAWPEGSAIGTSARCSTLARRKAPISSPWNTSMAKT